MDRSYSGPDAFSLVRRGGAPSVLSVPGALCLLHSNLRMPAYPGKLLLYFYQFRWKVFSGRGVIEVLCGALVLIDWCIPLIHRLDAGG
jgi:hypothetical protein